MNMNMTGWCGTPLHTLSCDSVDAFHFNSTSSKSANHHARSHTGRQSHDCGLLVVRSDRGLSRACRERFGHARWIF